MAVRSSEKQKNECIKVMGAELGSLFYFLWQDVAWLYRKWNEYASLFGKNQSRFDLMNEAAPHFFGVVHDALLEATLLHIARLTDPPETGTDSTKRNLTILRLPVAINDEAARERIRKLVDEAVGAAAFCRNLRNKWIAHRDLGVVLDAEPTLEPVTRQQIRLAMDEIATILNEVHSCYMKGNTCFDVPTFGDAVALLYVIDDGLRARRQEEERMERGELPTDNFSRRVL